MPVPDSLADSLTVPRHPGAPQRTSFPLLAVLAPLVGAAVLFAVTRSPLMLAFAALSPVIAVAGTIDGRISARRRRRADARTYAAQCERFLLEVASAQHEERALLNAEHPCATAVMSDPAHRPRRWRATADSFVPVRIGTGTARSRVAVSGAGDTTRERELLAVARALDDAPITADVSTGIGVLGPLPVARAFVRGIVVQVASAHPPGVLAILAPPGEAYDWLDDYPHASLADAEPLTLRIVDDRAESRVAESEDGSGCGDGGSTAQQSSYATELAHSPWRTGRTPKAATAVLAVAERVDHLPTGCRVVIEVDGAGSATLLTSPDGSGEIVAELVTAQAGAAFGRDLAVTARTRGVAQGRALPAAVAFSDVVGAAASPALTENPVALSQGLPATVGSSAFGPLSLDLVASGPHAIVTGTTGSGKSELLICWVLAMAAVVDPTAVNFLLVDFKGGTAFQRLAALPHTVGVVTDLGHGEAGRALKSLGAELRRREAALAALGVSDVRHAGGSLPRLVIVVDEAAAMLAAFPELGSLFADMAARGRALGVHLILGTQRATGVLSDALVANCALRISLRLASESDSEALLGSDAAARLPHGVPGRFVVARDGELVTAQAATVSADDVDAVVRAHVRSSRPRAPWLPALPERIPLSAFGQPPGGSIVLGARDDPDRQAQEGILYRPANAHLLVLGVRGSGKSTALAAVEAQWQGASIFVPHDVEGAWDAIERAEARVHAGPGDPLVVLIDDVDALVARFGDEHRDAVVERIRALLADGPRSGVGVVCSAGTVPSGLRAVAAHFGERLVLRQADRQEHTLAGAPADLYDPAAPPGRGVWHDRLAQVVLIEETRRAGSIAADPVELTFEPGSTTLVVARAPGSVVARLRASAGIVTAERRSLTDVLDVSDPPGGSVRDRARVDVIDLSDLADGASVPGGPSANDVTVRSGATPVVLVGDPDAWQAQWSLLGRLRRRSSLVFDGCSLAQVRATLHSRVLPPPTAPGHALLCDADGGFSRVRMPL